MKDDSIVVRDEPEQGADYGHSPARHVLRRQGRWRGFGNSRVRRGPSRSPRIAIRLFPVRLDRSKNRNWHDPVCDSRPGKAFLCSRVSIFRSGFVNRTKPVCEFRAGLPSRTKQGARSRAGKANLHLQEHGSRPGSPILTKQVRVFPPVRPEFVAMLDASRARNVNRQLAAAAAWNSLATTA